MQINLEATDTNSVQSYSQNKIQINSICYDKSLIVSRQEIISDLAIKSILDMDQAVIDLILKLKPEVVLIGHEQAGKFPPMQLINELGKLRIGIECMSIGAAARTFNVLLSEHRNVVSGFIFR